STSQFVSEQTEKLKDTISDTVNSDEAAK
ncbi:TPA: Asp23/Gls24 family envelope stress response protein, partial [Streptococcus pyogenes]